MRSSSAASRACADADGTGRGRRLRTGSPLTLMPTSAFGSESYVDPLGCLGQPCAQAFDEVGRDRGNAEPSAVLVDLRLALGPGQQLFTVIGVGVRSPNSDVAGLESIGEARKDAHFEMAACDAMALVGARKRRCAARARTRMRGQPLPTSATSRRGHPHAQVGHPAPARRCVPG